MFVKTNDFAYFVMWKWELSMPEKNEKVNWMQWKQGINIAMI